MAKRPTLTEPNRDILQPVMPPIPDADRDGKLTGADIIAQLLAEQPHLLDETKKLPAHALMRSIDANDLAGELTYSIKQNSRCDEHVLAQIAKAMNARLELAVMNFGDRPNAALRKQVESSARAFAAEKQLSPQETDFNVHTILTEVDFAHTFRDVFPRGIAITAQEVPGILELFTEKPEPILSCLGKGGAPQR